MVLDNPTATGGGSRASIKAHREIIGRGVSGGRLGMGNMQIRRWQWWEGRRHWPWYSYAEPRNAIKCLI